LNGPISRGKGKNASTELFLNPMGFFFLANLQQKRGGGAEYKKGQKLQIQTNSSFF
jgi:hypothetical protein